VRREGERGRGQRGGERRERGPRGRGGGEKRGEGRRRRMPGRKSDSAYVEVPLRSRRREPRHDPRVTRSPICDPRGAGAW